MRLTTASGVGGSVAHFAQGADDAWRCGIGTALDDGVQPILRGEPGGRGATALGERRNAPVCFAAVSDSVLGVHRLVGAVEGAQPEVDLADTDASRIGLWRRRGAVVSGAQCVHASTPACARTVASGAMPPLPPSPPTASDEAAAPIRTAVVRSSPSASRAVTVPANTSPAPVWSTTVGAGICRLPLRRAGIDVDTGGAAGDRDGCGAPCSQFGGGLRGSKTPRRAAHSCGADGVTSAQYGASSLNRAAPPVRWSSGAGSWGRRRSGAPAAQLPAPSPARWPTTPR